MFRKPAKPAAAPTSTVNPGTAEPGRILNDLLARPSLEGVLEAALTQAAELVGANVKGYAVLKHEEERVVAVLGYERDMLGMQLSGPWSSGKSRVTTDGTAELFATNSPEVRARLDVLGMREAKSSLIAPIRDRNRFLGALVLDRYVPSGFAPAQLNAVSNWAASLTPLVSLLESREEARALSRQLSGMFVEAVESLDFDSVGHARQVAETALLIGRAVGLPERELDDLWYAATLHDLGKLQGEEGHALVGANLLHDVPQLAQAQLGVRHHHERWDGFGTPDKLAAEEIPLVARIVAVADAYVRKGSAFSADAGKYLDPRLVAALEMALRAES